MRKLLYTIALFVMASACSTKPESKPYKLGGRPVPTSAYGFLYDGIPGEGLYPQVYSRRDR